MSRRLAFVLSTALLATVVATTPAQADTTITYLGELPGAQSHWAAPVNDAGVAVGVAFNGNGRDRAVRFDGDGTATELRGPADASTTVNEVNNQGTAVGTTSGGTVGGTRAIRFKPDGTYAVLSVPAGFDSALGLAITDSGTAYGIATNADRRQIPVRWKQDGVLTSMKMPEGATWAYVTSAAANGYVAGYVSGPGVPFLAVRWNPDGSVTELARLADGAATSAQAVNQLGEVVGNANTADDKQTWGVRWNADGSVTEISQEVYPRGINDHGAVVGFAYAGADQHPILWDRNGEKLELGFPEGVTSAGVRDINNEGVIVGSAGSRAVKWVVS